MSGSFLDWKMLRDCSALYAPDLLELLLKVIAHVLTAAPR
jgi:hypothetical protein